jgi:hypothetical protein
VNEALRKLNDEGVRQFSDWLRDGAVGPVPVELLSRTETSAPLKATIIVPRSNFADRFDFGVYLNEVLGSLDRAGISGDRGLWTALALRWFDLLCPPKAAGSRNLREEYYYILSSDYRHYYRHLVRSPWQLVHEHGENARFLLTSPKDQGWPLSVHGELLEQFGGRQQVLANKPIIAEASRLYLDPATGRPRKGAAGSGAGSARRFAFVLRQLDLTYDPACMENGALLAVLPKEFDRWKADATGAAAPASASRRARDR